MADHQTHLALSVFPGSQLGIVVKGTALNLGFLTPNLYYFSQRIIAKAAAWRDAVFTAWTAPSEVTTVHRSISLSQVLWCLHLLIFLHVCLTQLVPKTETHTNTHTSHTHAHTDTNTSTC